jgi:hypothetical protein
MNDIVYCLCRDNRLADHAQLALSHLTNAHFADYSNHMTEPCTVCSLVEPVFCFVALIFTAVLLVIIQLFPNMFQSAVIIQLFPNMFQSAVIIELFLNMFQSAVIIELFPNMFQSAVFSLKHKLEVI